MAKKYTSAREYSKSFTNKQRTVALVVVAMAFVMDLLDNTIVNVAIPTIQSNLGASYATIQWLIAGYSLTFALLLITGGRMGDVFGYKKLFMFGVGGFTVASLLCGLSNSPEMLIAARLLQGSMAALMVPQVMSLMQIMYEPHERGAINGLFGALGGVAASLGPVIGGLLIKANVGGLSWRPLFLINIPVGVFSFFAARKYLPEGKSPHPLRLDITGTLIILVAMGLLIFPLIQGREYDWPLWTFAMIGAALPMFGLFVWWLQTKEKRDQSALVAPSLFKNRSFGAGLLINLIFEAAMLGFFLTFTLVLQIGLGFSAIHAALTGLPIAFGIAITMATMGEKIIPKLGRRSINIGTLVMAVGLAATTLILAHYQRNIHSWQLIPSLLLAGIGMGFVFASLFAAVLNGVDTKHAGAASGILNAVQQVGGAIGVALIGVIFFGQVTGAASSSFDTATPHLKSSLTVMHVPEAAQEQIISNAKQCFIDRSKQKDPAGVPASCKLNAENGTAPSDLATNVTNAALDANARNFNRAFRYGVMYEVTLLVVVFAATYMLPKKFRAEAYQEGA